VHGDTADDRVHKLEAVLGPAEMPPEDITLIANLLSVPTGNRYPRPEFSPQRKKEKTFAALTRRLAVRAREQPVLMLLEDAHWADPSSLELLDAVIGLLSELPILLVISFLPEFTAPWIGHAGVTLLTLSRLDRRQAAELTRQVTIKQALPPALFERVVAQTDGVPLFIEELTKVVLEAATQPAGVTLAVPDTLQASLMARLDRLPAAKQVAQIGSVIGRAFSQTLLAAVAQLPEAQLAQSLDELVASGLAIRRGISPDAIYSFKHSLVQEAAYDSLLRSRRAEIHAVIVATVEADPSVATLEPGVLGQHCVQAGLIAMAVNYYRIAGVRLAEQSALVETRLQLERGMALAESLPSGPNRDRIEAELLLAFGRFLMVTKGNADAEAVAILDRAVALCRRANLLETLAPVLYSLGTCAVQRADIPATRTIGEELLALGMHRMTRESYRPVIHGFAALRSTKDGSWRRRITAPRRSFNPPEVDS
jgi:predicted ATPase